MDLGLAGRACVVTGASRGIGRETAIGLCAEGASVLLVARGEERLREVQEEAVGAGIKAGGRAAVLALDVTLADAGERMLATAGEYFGGLNVLVNNAGAASWRDLDDVPDEDWRAQYELNLVGPPRGAPGARPGDGRERLGPHRQRLLDRRQAPLRGDAGVLGRQGRRALALAPRRRPLREAGRSRQRDLPRARRIGDVDGPGRPARPVPGAEWRGQPRGGAGRSRRQAPDRPPRRPNRDRRRHRLPLLRPRLLRGRRRLVGRRGHRPSNHLMAGALALLRDRPRFRALWAALALSYTGSGAALTALILYVQQTRGTGTAVAALLIAETVPRLLGPLAGSLADRVDLRQLMIGADLGQAALFAALAFLPPFAAILALAALTSTLQPAYGPARPAAAPALVEDSELLQANSLTGVAANLFVGIGPLVGGALFAIGGAAAVMALNTATFLLSALLTRRIPALPPEQREQAGEAREPFFASARTGLRYALANPVTRTITLTILFMFAFLSIDNVALVFLVRDTLGGGAVAYGLISAAFGAGMLVSSLGIMRGSDFGAPRLYLLGVGLSSLGALLTGFAPTLLLAAAIQLVCGGGNGIEIVAGDTAFPQGVPRHLLGRVYGLTSTAVGIGTGIAMVLGGFLVDATSPRIAFLVAGVGGLLVTAIAAPTLLRAR